MLLLPNNRLHQKPQILEHLPPSCPSHQTRLKTTHNLAHLKTTTPLEHLPPSCPSHQTHLKTTHNLAHLKTTTPLEHLPPSCPSHQTHLKTTTPLRNNQLRKVILQLHLLL